MTTCWGRSLLALLLVACTQPATLSHFSGDGIAFDYPSRWNAATFDMPSSFNHWIVWLSTEQMADPCDRVSSSGRTSISCDRSPVVGQLGANGLLLDWSTNGFLGWEFDANAGESITVGGRRATLQVLDAGDEECFSIGGSTRVRVIVPSSVAYNWTQMDACINGPFAGAVEDQVKALLASVAWD